MKEVVNDLNIARYWLVYPKLFTVIDSTQKHNSAAVLVPSILQYLAFYRKEYKRI